MNVTVRLDNGLVESVDVDAPMALERLTERHGWAVGQKLWSQACALKDAQSAISTAEADLRTALGQALLRLDEAAQARDALERADRNWRRTHGDVWMPMDLAGIRLREAIRALG